MVALLLSAGPSLDFLPEVLRRARRAEPYQPLTRTEREPNASKCICSSKAI